MNIWLLHPYAGGPNLGRHRRPYCMAEAFNALGHRAIVVCARRHHLLHRIPTAAGLERIGEVDYWFVDTPPYEGNSLSRLHNMLSFGPRFAKDAAKLAALTGRPDIVIASSPHLFQMPAAYRVAKKFGAKFWVEVRDLWPESLVALGLSKRASPLVMWLALLERYALRRADTLLSLLANAEPHMRARGFKGDFRWVPNGVSPPAITAPAAHDCLTRIDALKAAGKRVIAYTGAMGPPNALEGLIDCARLLAAPHPEIHFVLVGKGISLPELKARSAGLGNIDFIDEVPFAAVQGVLQRADCAVILFRGHPIYHMGISPNKLFEYALSAPRSLIACDAEALYGLESLVNTRCEPDKPEALAAAVVKTLNAPPRSENERDLMLAPFQYTRLAARCLE